MADIRFLQDYGKFLAGHILTGKEGVDVDELFAKDIVAFVVPGEPKPKPAPKPKAAPKKAPAKK